MDGVTVSSEVFWAVGGILAAISQLQRLQATVCLVLVSGKVEISSSVPLEQGVFYSAWAFKTAIMGI